jgi:methyl halide transferase
VKILDENYWSNKYSGNDTGWDLNGISTPLKEYFDQLTAKDLAILIPGCGSSYEAGYLLQHGFSNITLIDISAVLCNKLRKTFHANLDSEVRIICADFFQHEGQYDLIIEQTFFCALDPSLRKEYAAHMHQLLKPGGKLTGVLFNRDFEGGPPFGGTEEEYRQLFEPFFEIAIMEPCYNSIKPRSGAELFIQLINKAS